jgi:hypothetical protein
MSGPARIRDWATPGDRYEDRYGDAGEGRGIPSHRGEGIPKLDLRVIQQLSQSILTAPDLWASDPQVSEETTVGAVVRWFKSRARNHLQANRSLAFRFQVTA